MKFHPDIIVYGDRKFRGACPSETLEQVTFFARLRAQHPLSWGVLTLHPRNEGRRHFRQAQKEASEGMTVGAPDIVIPGRRTFICELKRRDHTKSKLSAEQELYLLTTDYLGAFCCIALGADAAMEAFNDYLDKCAPAQRQSAISLAGARGPVR